VTARDLNAARQILDQRLVRLAGMTRSQVVEQLAIDLDLSRGHENQSTTAIQLIKLEKSNSASAIALRGAGVALR
jgi:hypothetical protein